MIASASDDNTVKLWNLDGKVLKTLQGSSNKVNSVSFSPDGKMIASASDYSVILWSSNGNLIKTFRSFGKRSVSFSPDSKTIVAADDSGTMIWSLDLDELMRQGCDWVRDYLKNPTAKVDESDRTLCDDILPQK
jgi:WD40 repeat protein